MKLQNAKDLKRNDIIWSCWHQTNVIFLQYNELAITYTLSDDPDLMEAPMNEFMLLSEVQICPKCESTNISFPHHVFPNEQRIGPSCEGLNGYCYSCQNDINSNNVIMLSDVPIPTNA